MECKLYLIVGKRERIFELQNHIVRAFWMVFFGRLQKIWTGNRPFVADEVVKRLLPLHRVEVGKGETAIPAR